LWSSISGIIKRHCKGSCCSRSNCSSWTRISIRTRNSKWHPLCRCIWTSRTIHLSNL